MDGLVDGALSPLQQFNYPGIQYIQQDLPGRSCLFYLAARFLDPALTRDTHALPLI